MMDQAAKFFWDNRDVYFTLLKHNWLHECKKGVIKSSKFTRLDFKSEYGDFIVLLNRVMGVPQGMQFESWMYYFIDEIVNGKGKFDWARIISENLELHLRVVQNQKQSYMARLYKHPGLKALGVIGNGLGQCLVHECYP